MFFLVQLKVQNSNFLSKSDSFLSKNIIFLVKSDKNADIYTQSSQIVLLDKWEQILYLKH